MGRKQQHPSQKGRRLGRYDPSAHSALNHKGPSFEEQLCILRVYAGIELDSN